MLASIPHQRLAAEVTLCYTSKHFFLGDSFLITIHFYADFSSSNCLLSAEMVE